MTSIIEAQGLVKHYGTVKALDGLDLSVPQGTILGLLGPNGAGKTTAVSILTTLLRPDAGTATVAGADLLTDPREVRRRIGLSGQYAAVDENLTGFENLDMVGRLYRLGRQTARTRARELLDQFDLDEAADRPVKTYSGGMRRRLDLAAAIVGEPRVLFLDEPTTGLDPRSRTTMWSVIRRLVGRGTTLLLTTQYMEEADQLADDIVVIDRGREIAHGSPNQLKALIGDERIELTLASEEEIATAAEVVRRFADGEVQIEHESRSLVAPIANATVFTRAIGAIEDAGIELHDVGLRRPTLDDVFLTLTGHHVEEDEVEPETEVTTGEVPA